MTGWMADTAAGLGLVAFIGCVFGLASIAQTLAGAV